MIQAGAGNAFLPRIEISASFLCLAPILVVATSGWMLFDVLSLGLDTVSWAFLIEAPRAAGRAGGIGPILVSTALIVSICLAAALPLALGTALLLSECLAKGSRSAQFMRVLLDVLASVPSIAFGAFGYVFFAQVLHLGFSILSGGLTLATMVLPLLVGSIEQSLRAVPLEIRMASAGVGFSRAQTLFLVLLPIAAPGILVGVLLGIGRALAETAALVFTSGYVARLPGSLLDSGRTLSVHIYDLSMNVPGGEPAAAATTLVLIASLLLMNGAFLCFLSYWKRRSGMALAVTA